MLVQTNFSGGATHAALLQVATRNTAFLFDVMHWTAAMDDVLHKVMASPDIIKAGTTKFKLLAPPCDRMRCTPANFRCA